MDILILFDDTKKFCILISSVVQVLRRDFPNSDIEISSGDDSCRKLLLHVPGITNVSQRASKVKYDIVYCFDDRLSNLSRYSNLKFDKYVGYQIDGSSIKFTSDLVKDFFYYYCLKESYDGNLLQMIFECFGLNWNREGFKISYKTRSRSKEGRNGAAISNDNLRSLVKNNIFNDGSKLWHIPIRQDPLKCIDEVNKCSNIVTDNIFYAFIGSFLRKKIIFLVEDGCDFNPDIFGDIFVQHVSTQVLYAQD
ncbi:hypothetical protein CMI47_08925 [Candidatus Pacearchaeota archaeon]|jgi:hypothetical protein|nr:hypothetical protein [Candidatus Pacearchaeota archaeon]|tara:strand:+ start:2017 stop:2769 length:753 start_codon:yes stop_codon:yes gene_type:complete